MSLDVELKNLSYEEKQDLLGFFDLLLTIDKRLNPNEYEIKPLKQEVIAIKRD